MRQVPDPKNRNIHSTNKSGTAGVGFHKASGKWIARINVKGEEKYLGLRKKKADAIKLRKDAEKEFWN